MLVVDLLCDPIYTLADRWRQGTLHRTEAISCAPPRHPDLGFAEG
jgi:hypothetical protein